MRSKGIHYDTGTFPAGRSSRPGFHPDDVRRDLALIADELRCDAVRITGGELDRITLAATCAADAGLEVWYSPHPCELDAHGMAALFDEAASRAETVRARSAHPVVLVLGCEISVFGAGLVPGADAYQRMANLAAPTTELLAPYASIVERLHDLLGSAAARARERFGGAVTYAAGAWEPVDWAPFDLVAVDAYRDVTNATTYRDEIRRLTGQPKPVAVTEFGCCTFHGAAALGARGWAILEGTGPERRVAGEVQRDEAEQARYVTDLLAIYEDEGVDAAFWYTFASFDKPRRRSSDEDLDLASFGVVAVEEPDEDGRYRTLTRKESFAALAAHQGRR